MPKPLPIPIFQYTAVLTDATERSCNAMQYAVDGLWLVFDAPDGTVLSLRSDLVQEVRRSPEPVGHYQTEQM